RTYVLEADEPLGPYREAGRLFDAHHDRWAIDLTVLEHEGRLYALWSGREGEAKFPQNLYIAAMADPCTIAGRRSCISTPEHDWEMSVAAVNEAPEILRNWRQGKLFVAYSADASWTRAYKMGLLEWREATSRIRPHGTNTPARSSGAASTAASSRPPGAATASTTASSPPIPAGPTG